jgi:hypothetical protein
MSRSAWKDPTVQGEFSAWRDRLAGWGVELTAEEFEDGLWELAQGYMDARNQVLAPFRRYYAYAGTWQSWRMFVAPHRHPGRLHIEVREGGDYRTVYVARSDEHTWLRSQLDHDRMRSSVFRYAWKRYYKHWRVFGTWVAKQAAEDFPEADRVRLRFFRYQTLSPEAARAGAELEGKFELPISFALGDYR